MGSSRRTLKDLEHRGLLPRTTYFTEMLDDASQHYDGQRRTLLLSGGVATLAFFVDWKKYAFDVSAKVLVEVREKMSSSA